MIRVYFAAILGGAIFFAYFIGVHIANIKCNERIANANLNQMVINATAMEKTNDTVLHTGISDIRRILRERYTIAE